MPGWRAARPTRTAPRPSPSRRGTGARPCIHCHAGCSTVNDVVAAVGLTLEDLFERRNGDRRDDIIATYPYVDENNTLLFEVVRKTGKKFVCRRPDGAGGWIWKLGDTRRVLYGLPSVIAAVAAGHPVFICEGEKDADRLRAEGATATCNPHGAGKWAKVSDAPDVLHGANVLIVVDKDEAGYAHGRDVATLADRQGEQRSSSPRRRRARTPPTTWPPVTASRICSIIAGTDAGDPPLADWLAIPSLADCTPCTPPPRRATRHSV